MASDQSVLHSRRKQIADNLGRLDAQVNNLVDSIARLGLTGPLERGIQERQVEARRLEHELAEVDAQLNQPRIELADDALEYLAANLREELRGDSLEDVQRVLRQALVRVELAEKEMTIYYVSPLLERPKTVIAPVPPWEASLIDGLSPIVQVADATLEAVPTGRASPRYQPNWKGSGPADSLPPVQRQLYELVERSGVITAHALADALEMSHANAATVLLELYHRGLVDREPICNSEGLHYSWRVHHGGSRE